MATVTITHSTVTGAVANPDVLVDGPAWDAVHTVTGLENVQNVDTTNASNLTSGTVAAARMPALTGDVTTSVGSVATTLATVNSNVGSFGSATKSATITVNAKGLVTAASESTISSGVTSIASNVGAFTLGIGITNSTNVILVDPAYLRGYISGLTTSNNAITPNTKVDVSAGVATDDTQAILMKLSSGTIDLTTTGANGLDTGSLANSTWYHLFAIAKTDGTVSRLASTSATSPTFPSGYTLKRRIGSFKTDGSAHVIAYIQNGFDFLWAVPTNDYNGGAGSLGTSAITATLNVPTSVAVRARIRYYLNANDGVRRTALVTSLSQTDSAPAAGTLSSIGAGLGATAGGTTQAGFDVWTNTSGQIRHRLDGSGVNTTVFIDTDGWFDPL